jgi:signal transduction histidine kinase
MLAFARDGSRDPFQSENPILLVNQVIESCAFKAKKMNVELRSDIKNPYLSLECRSTEISQLLINLIQNGCDAVQALDERWVEVKVEEKGEAIEFHIRDSGLGIPQELLRDIFNPFFTTKAVGQGTGLGLSIAKSIVENHSGTIEVDSLSHHTTIVVSIPKKQIKGPES